MTMACLPLSRQPFLSSHASTKQNMDYNFSTPYSVLGSLSAELFCHEAFDMFQYYLSQAGCRAYMELS